jgi:hypothetical protein
MGLKKVVAGLVYQTVSLPIPCKANEHAGLMIGQQAYDNAFFGCTVGQCTWPDM